MFVSCSRRLTAASSVLAASATWQCSPQSVVPRRESACARPSCGGLVFEIDIGERLPFGVADAEALGCLVNYPGVREAAGSGGQAAFLLQSFNDPNIAHSTIAKGLQSFLISRTAVGSRRLFQARILGNYRTLLQPVFVSKRGVPACEKASTKRRGRGYCELRIGCKFLGFRHNAIPPFISRAWDHTSVCRLDR
jgi:hypothetical protein